MKLNVVADFSEGRARELRQRRLIEEQENIENCFNPGELYHRLSRARIDIWYLSALAKGDVTRHHEVRQSLFFEGMRGLKALINSNS